MIAAAIALVLLALYLGAAFLAGGPFDPAAIAALVLVLLAGGGVALYVHRRDSREPDTRAEAARHTEGMMGRWVGILGSPRDTAVEADLRAGYRAAQRAVRSTSILRAREQEAPRG